MPSTTAPAEMTSRFEDEEKTDDVMSYPSTMLDRINAIIDMNQSSAKKSSLNLSSAGPSASKFLREFTMEGATLTMEERH